MKTIEEKSFEYKENVDLSNICDTKDVRFEIQDAFTAGVEFAQRWIPMNEGLPLRGIEIIVKNKWCKRVFCPNSIGDIKWCSERFTHWRPIEIK